MYSNRLAKFTFSLLKLPPTTHVPLAFKGNAEQILKTRNSHFSSIYPQTQNPLIITEGHLQYLFDHKGNRYLDLQATGGLVNLGHCHPAIQEVISKWASKLIHTSTIYQSQNQGTISKLLTEQLGQGFQNVYLCNSAAEAIDFSLMVARVFAQQNTVYSYRNSYHGLVGNGRSVSSVGKWNSAFPDKFDSEKISWPLQSESLTQTTNKLKQIIATAPSGRPGVLVYENIQAKNGARLPRAGYFNEATKIFRQNKAITLCDQSSTGLGRIGKSSWGFKWQGHTPDIVTIGASLSNGHAMGAVVTRKEISSAVKHMWFNTFAAGHLQTRIAVETLNVLKREKLAQNAETVGNYLLAELKNIAQKHKSISAVNGKGLVIGIEINNNDQPCEKKAKKLLELAKDRQVLLGRGGIHGNAIHITPPLCITLEDAKYAVQAIDDALHHLK